MSCDRGRDLAVLFSVIAIFSAPAIAYFNPRSFECGPYGFVCEGTTRLRLCNGVNRIGPSFLCPLGTLCNEDSNDVCENAVNFVDTALRDVRCRRNERIADQSVPDCKGYILCIPNKNRFQGIKFKCTGNTVFNGFTRTCTAPDKYRCPLSNSTPATDLRLYESENRGISSHHDFNSPSPHGTRPIDCKNYKLKVTEDRSPARVAYFCPSRPEKSGGRTKCTVFSNQFCIMLERVDQDSFIQASGAANRKPRIHKTYEKTV